MNPLDKRRAAEERAYGRLLELAEAKVVRWEYWDGFHWHWDPSEIKSETNEGLSKRAPKQTKRKDAYYIYGFDAMQRVVVIRQEFHPGQNEEFIRYAGNTLVASSFYDGQLLEVAKARLANGRVVRVEKSGAGSDWWTIEWRGDQVARILFGMFGEKAGLEWCYDESGKLIGMFDLPCKLRLPKGVTVKSLTRLIYGQLMQLVPRVAAGAGIKQPVYCLALAYDGEGNGVLPPALGIGLESERQSWMKKDMKKAKSLIWNPAEFRHYETKRLSLPHDKKFETSCGWYNQLLERRGSDAPARVLLNKVAGDLAKLDWSGKLSTTEDFVVFAVDYEGADLTRNLKHSVPAKTLARLRKMKMV